MADPTDRDAERLDAWLDGSGRDGGDLTAFADRIVHDAALPVEPDGLTTEQRDRLRARVVAGAPHTEKARPTVNAITFAPNGATTAPIPIREPERPAPSKLSVLMTAALVAIIAVAGFGVLRGGIDLPGGSGDPAPTGMPALAWSPVASPATETDCSRDQWVTVFDDGVPDILKETAHATLDEGTLRWHCGGESEELATNVNTASGVFWPGVISLVTEDDEVRLINIASDASLDLDGDLVLNDDGEIDYRNGFAWSGGPEPWIATLANSERTDWRVIDVRSMESLLLSDELGGPLPRPFTPSFGQITGTDVAVVSWRSDAAWLSGTPVRGGGVEQRSTDRALVLPGSIDARRWIEITRYRIQATTRWGASQEFSVSPDGTLLAYTTVTNASVPVIRVEDAASGDKLVDVPIDGIDADTQFILAGTQPHLAYTNGDTVRILALAPDASREIAEIPDPDVIGFLPTADPDTILASINYSYTAVTPINVTTGAAPEFYGSVPPLYSQLFGNYEVPKDIVRVVSDPETIGQSIIQLVNPATGDVILESVSVDANPVQVVSFDTFLRDGGELAVVPIGYNRAVVMDATTGESWEIAAPVDDDRIWHFFPSYDGRFVTAYPEPPVGTTGADRSEAWVAPLEPGAEWVPLDGAGDDVSMLIPGTPAG